MSIQDVRSGRAINLPARAAVRAGLGFAALVALWLGSYLLGLFPWLGYAAVDRSSIGVGPNHFIIGEDRAGSFFLGPMTFVFVAGQTVVVSYDAEIRRGCLWMQVWHILDHSKNASVYQCIMTGGRGEWTVPINETGLYRIFIDGSPIKGNRPGWDMTYSVWWGARW
jgi:hypothetical protein